jgi:hypothetical protein
MSDAKARTLSVIAPYLGKVVEADLDGKLFDHRKARFRFRFADPGALWEQLQDGYEDYLTKWPKELVPVASVSKSGSDYKFAWLFLDWRDGATTPRVVVTTTDDWKGKRTVDSLEALGLEIGDAADDDDGGDD